MSTESVPSRGTDADTDAGRITGTAPPFRDMLRPSTVPTSAEAGDELPAVPGYEVLSELGRGGMGVVYLARQCSLGRLVALKMIQAGAAAGLADRARLRNEAAAVARLQHPNIVHIYEIGEHNRRPFLALEYVPGSNLARYIAGSPLSECESAGLVETLARAVHYAHQQGVVHRDLKPGNVLLVAGDGWRVAGEDGLSSSPATCHPPPATLFPKITDFGLAKFLDQDGGLTRSEMLLGTPNYMAPEQAAGKGGQAGVPADVYALGAILYELLTGRPPFDGGSVPDVLEQVRTREPTPPRRLRPAVSRDLETVCLKCLEKESRNRYATAGDLADDLHRFLEGIPIQARPVPTWQRAIRSLRRRPVLVARLLAALAIVCLLVTGGFYYRTAGRLADRQGEERYREFVRQRDRALVHGLLAADERALLLGGDATTQAEIASTAAREALRLAGLDPGAERPVVDQSLPAAARSEVAADCYNLLLVLADLPGQPDADGQAERWLDAAGRLGIESRAYHLRRARLLDRRGDKADAAMERDRSASLAAESALDHFLTGGEQYRRGELEAARASFDRALARDPGHFWAQFFLAVCQLRARQWDAAKAGLNACLAKQPGFLWARLFRSVANQQLGAAGEALADFQAVMELNRDPEALYAVFLTRGILYFHQDQFDLAECDFQSARTQQPVQYHAFVNLAHLYLVQDRLDEAEEQMVLARPLRLPPRAEWGYQVERGRRLLRLNKYEQALQAGDEAVAVAPEEPLAHDLRGRALLGLGRFEQAEQAFDRYLDHGGPAAADVFRGRGTARMKQSKYPEAADDYTRALELAPDAELYQHRGWAHFFADAWKLARRDFDQAVKLDPRSADAYTGRGLASVMIGDDRAAVADAETALRLKPGTAEMMHNLACVFAQASARAEAETAGSSRRRAVELVRQTLAMLPAPERSAFWRDKVLPDPALAPIRGEPGFRRLREEYAASPRPGPAGEPSAGGLP